MKRSLARVLLLLSALGCASQAQAHLMVANKGTVSIKENNAYVVISVPVSALSGFDDNHDNLIDSAELGRHSGSLRTQVDGRIRITADGTESVERLTYLVSALTGDDENVPTNYVVVMSVRRFEQPPQVVQIWTDLYGTSEKDQGLALKASRGESEELAVLTPDRPQHRFFRGAIAVFADFLQLGVSHILLGYDHLLFLLTIIVAAMSVRHWLIVISGFTVAHSFSLVAASLEWVSVSPQIAEPLIAASIVALALDNLLGGTRRPFALRAMVVFACGLLHGLGFASSLADLGISKHNIVSSLVGFNLGVELGQIIFIGVVFGAMWLIARSNVPITRERLIAAVSVFAALPGAALLAMRIFPVV